MINRFSLTDRGKAIARNIEDDRALIELKRELNARLKSKLYKLAEAELIELKLIEEEWCRAIAMAYTRAEVENSYIGYEEKYNNELAKARKIILKNGKEILSYREEELSRLKSDSESVAYSLKKSYKERLLRAKGYVELTELTAAFKNEIDSLLDNDYK